MKTTSLRRIACDTSILISERVGDCHQDKARSLINSAGQSILVSRLNQLEFTTVVSRLTGEKKLSPKQAGDILLDFEEHLRIGVLESVGVDEARVWNHAIRLARLHSATLLARSLDVLQVAYGLEMGANEFWTFDERQKRLAEAVGLRINP